jgi:hypothetical protein
LEIFWGLRLSQQPRLEPSLPGVSAKHRSIGLVVCDGHHERNSYEATMIAGFLAILFSLAGIADSALAAAVSCMVM